MGRSSAAIFSDSYAHLYDENAPKCGLPTPGGACGWAREPKLPWCNRHLCEFFNGLYSRGIAPEQLLTLRLPPGVKPEDMADAYRKYLESTAKTLRADGREHQPRSRRAKIDPNDSEE